MHKELSGARVLLLPRYSARGGSSRERFYEYVPALEASGASVVIEPLFDDDYLTHRFTSTLRTIPYVAGGFARRLRTLTRVRKFDIVVLQMEALPYLPTLFESLAMRDVPFVVDIDDAWHVRYRHLPGLRRKMTDVAARARAVIVGSENLRQYYGPSNRNTVIIPTPVHPERYRKPPAAAPEGFVIGWIGSPSTVGYLKLIEKPLQVLCGQPGTSLRVMGGRTSLDVPNTTYERWDLLKEADFLQSISVGVMPVPDDEFGRGKCAYKILQYMAAGVPAVASPVGENCRVINPGDNGFLASSDDEWVAALQSLRDDRALRETFAVRALNLVESRYALKVTEEQFLSLLSEVLRTSMPMLAKD